MSNTATRAFANAIDKLNFHVDAVEKALANPSSGVCLSGSQLLDIHYQLLTLSKRLCSCARTIPPVESAELQDELIAQWEEGASESPDLCWSAGQMVSPSKASPNEVPASDISPRK